MAANQALLRPVPLVEYAVDNYVYNFDGGGGYLVRCRSSFALMSGVKPRVI